jgi:hypothetical protein
MSGRANLCVQQWQRQHRGRGSFGRCGRRGRLRWRRPASTDGLRQEDNRASRRGAPLPESALRARDHPGAADALRSSRDRSGRWRRRSKRATVHEWGATRRGQQPRRRQRTGSVLSHLGPGRRLAAAVVRPLFQVSSMVENPAAVLAEFWTGTLPAHIFERVRLQPQVQRGFCRRHERGFACSRHGAVSFEPGHRGKFEEVRGVSELIRPKRQS